MAISTLVLAMTGGKTGVGIQPTPKPTPPNTGGLREWVKKQLHTIANFLKQIAAKATAALPRIIGAVLSWIFQTASQGVEWLASDLWALLVALGGII